MTSLVALRRSLTDLRAPKRSVYFADLALTTGAIYAGLAVAGTHTRPVFFVVGVVIATLALSRGALFAHELAHQRNAVPGLRLAWHVAIGIPFLFPSFIYERVHREHHRLAIYRTERDPEHAPDPRSLLKRTLMNQSAALFVPALLLLRWAVATPLSFVIPNGRSWILRRFSSLTLNPLYVAPATQTKNELWAELACMAWSWALLAGVLPLRSLIAGALALGLATGLSDARGELLHRFGKDGETGTLERQVSDSINLPARGLVRLFYPMGIGYHAIHHLAPWLPYHAMETAYARTTTSGRLPLTGSLGAIARARFVTTLNTTGTASPTLS